MARTTPRPPPTATRTLQPLGRHCPLCGEMMWAAYHHYRTITTLEEVVHLTVQIQRYLTRTCPQFHCPYRPEEEGRLALPKHELGLDVIAWVGTLRYAQPRSLPEIYQHLRHRGGGRRPPDGYASARALRRTAAPLPHGYRPAAAHHSSPGPGPPGPRWPPTRRRP